MELLGAVNFISLLNNLLLRYNKCRVSVVVADYVRRSNALLVALSYECCVCKQYPIAPA